MCSGVADMARMRRSGRSVAARVDRQRQADVRREVAFVDLVEDDGGDAGQLGSRCSRRGQHALGDDLDPGVGPIRRSSRVW